MRPAPHSTAHHPITRVRGRSGGQAQGQCRDPWRHLRVSGRSARRRRSSPGRGRSCHRFGDGRRVGRCRRPATASSRGRRAKHARASVDGRCSRAGSSPGRREWPPGRRGGLFRPPRWRSDGCGAWSGCASPSVIAIRSHGGAASSMEVSELSVVFGVTEHRFDRVSSFSVQHGTEIGGQ